MAKTMIFLVLFCYRTADSSKKQEWNFFKQIDFCTDWISDAGSKYFLSILRDKFANKSFNSLVYHFHFSTTLFIFSSRTILDDLCSSYFWFLVILSNDHPNTLLSWESSFWMILIVYELFLVLGTAIYPIFSFACFTFESLAIEYISLSVWLFIPFTCFY